MDEIDIWRSAKLLIEKYAEQADLAACQRADELTAKGDAEGGRARRRIKAAIAALLKSAQGKLN